MFVLGDGVRQWEGQERIFQGRVSENWVFPQMLEREHTQISPKLMSANTNILLKL